MTAATSGDGPRELVVVEADGGSRGNPGPAGYGAVVLDPATGETLAETAEYIGVATNNVAEYRGLVAGLRAAHALDPAARVQVRMDSKLVVEQMSGRWQIKHPDMQPLAAEAGRSSRRAQVTYEWIPRERNKHADRLANEAMDAGKRGEQWEPSGVPAARPWTPVDAGRAAAARRVRPADSEPQPRRSLRRLGLRRPRRPRHLRPAAPRRDRPHPGEAVLRQWRHRPGALRHRPRPGRGRRRRARRARHRPGDRHLTAAPLPRDRGGRRVPGSAWTSPIEEGLRETDFGAWEGLTFAEVQERYPDDLDAWLASPEGAPTGGGESFATVDAAVEAARDRLLDRYQGRTVLLVTHVTPVKILVQLALGAPPESLFRMELSAASTSVVAYYADGNASVRLLNDTSHLR